MHCILSSPVWPVIDSTLKSTDSLDGQDTNENQLTRELSEPWNTKIEWISKI
jgi:hypothetical protein